MRSRMDLRLVLEAVHLPPLEVKVMLEVLVHEQGVLAAAWILGRGWSSAALRGCRSLSSPLGTT